MAAGWRGAELRLVGAGGEPADLRRTLDSHGLTSLAPFRLEETVPALEATLPQRRGAPRTVRISPGRAGHARVELLGPAVSQAAGRGAARDRRGTCSGSTTTSRRSTRSRAATRLSAGPRPPAPAG